MTTNEHRENPLLLLIDGIALAFLCWYSSSYRKVSSSGEDVSAVNDFLRRFFSVVNSANPTHCVVAYDMKAPTFRHKLFDDYKADRPPVPPALPPQFDRIRQLMEALGVPVMDVEGFEADDLLGSLCHQAERRRNLQTLVLTTDTDLLQLVSPSVNVMIQYQYGDYDTRTYNIAQVEKRYNGLGPQYVAEIKALQGDKTDNIPGVPRIGVKTATRLLSEFGSLEDIYLNIDEVHPPSVRKSLKENIGLAFLCKMLTTIRRDAPVKLDLRSARLGQYNPDDVIELLDEIELSHMKDRLP